VEYTLFVPKSRRLSVWYLGVQPRESFVYPGQRVLVQGTLSELIAFVRKQFGQTSVPHLLTLVAELQLGL